MRFAHSPLALAIFSALCPIAYANDAENAAVQPEVKLNTIVVEAAKADEVGQTTYSKEDLEKTPNSSKNITDFLKVNPNVQFSSDHRNGQNQGELAAQDFSINGGLAYDNKFLINGVSFNNNLNPGSSAGSNNPSDLIGSSQSVTINTDLLCNLTVLDSNVSAEYGEFVGGVVKATTCAPKTPVGEFHGQVSYDYTSDDWSRIHFHDKDEEADFSSSTSEEVQPTFIKQGISASVYGNLTENLGMSLIGAQRWSKIPLNTTLLEPSRITQNRQNNDLSLEIFYTPSEKTQLKLGTQLFDNKGDYFQSNVKDSYSTHQSDSQTFYINLQNQLNNLSLEQQFNYQTQNAERDGADNVYTWRYAAGSKDWANSSTVNEGSFGQFEQQQKSLEYFLKATLNPIVTGNINHKIKFGAGYGHYDAYWKRDQNSYWYTTTANLNNQSCTASNGNLINGCDEALTANNFQGQYFSGRTVYGAGEINVRQDRWHAFIEDSIKWNETLFATLGLRTDYDSLTKETNFAPRSAFNYQPFNTPELKFSAGWNRYYGLNAFANELQAEKRLLQSAETRKALNQDWINTLGSQYANMSRKSQLETPYSDELLFAVSGIKHNLDWSLKWVNRDNKKQVRQSEWDTIPKDQGTGTYTVYTYENSGESESDIFTLTLRNATPLIFAQSAHVFSFAADYTDTVRNFNNYDGRYEDPNTTIYYDGKYINAGDRPADNFNTPWTARFSWDIDMINLPIHINNFFSYSSSKDVMKKTVASNKNSHKDEDGNSYDTYTPFKNKSTFSWDMRGTYKLPLSNRYESILGLTINNVTNKHNTITNDSGDVKSEIGRQFIADITFKF